MPELPDVETYRRYFQKKALKHKIKSLELRDRRFLEKGSQNLSLLKNASFTSTKRHGKNLFASASNGLFLAMHFGMTGYLMDFREKTPFERHTRLLIHFNNDHFLAFVDMRILGHISVIDSIEEYIRQKNLGPDALDIPYDYFESLFKGSGHVKGLLMDQHKIAGIGNIYADEILFQSKIDPRSRLARLHDKEIKILYKAISHVLKKAIEVHADVDGLPSSWLLPVRNVKELCPKCQGEIQKITLNGRGTYFCPHCQKLF